MYKRITKGIIRETDELTAIANLQENQTIKDLVQAPFDGLGGWCKAPSLTRVGQRVEANTAWAYVRRPIQQKK